MESFERFDQEEIRNKSGRGPVLGDIPLKGVHNFMVFVDKSQYGLDFSLALMYILLFLSQLPIGK